MTSLSERQQLIRLIDEATDKGARLSIACTEIGISRRTYRRWKADNLNQGDKRPTAIGPAPYNKLSDSERQAILDACNEPRFASLPPSQIVLTLLDEGIYHASESSFYRVLKQHNQLSHRGRAKAKKPRKPPETFIVTKPCQVFCWDITYLPSTVRGQFYYLYLIEDIYSRKIVGYEAYDKEPGDLAAKLLERTLLNENAIGAGVVLHSDNGAVMKSQTLRMKAYELGVLTSYSRPRVSNDNPFAESVFRSVKYAPSFPEYGFDSLETARVWVNDFVSWYNNEHKHSGLNFVTPNERHTLKDAQVLARRERVLLKAKQANPVRWNGRNVRNCSPVPPTALNPVRPSKRVEASEILVA
ncbi:hypothetical protein ENHYD8BJ_140002 [Enhydrobacter sp. 8BJ]|nr:hypothetical protein ENHYD8BJ_140002 [Enhydrobacter sp. 8BJ]